MIGIGMRMFGKVLQREEREELADVLREVLKLSGLRLVRFNRDQVMVVRGEYGRTVRLVGLPREVVEVDGRLPGGEELRQVLEGLLEQVTSNKA